VRQLITFLATGAYVGRISAAPGTLGSLLAIPLLAAVPRLRLSTSALLALLAAPGAALALPLLR